MALGSTRPGSTLTALSVSGVCFVMADYSLVHVVSVEIQFFYLLSEVSERVTVADTSGPLSISDS